MIRLDERGFTLNELLVSMIVFGLVLGSITILFNSNLAVVNENQVRTSLEGEARVAGVFIQEDIQLAAQALLANSITDTYKASGWSWQASHPGVLILEAVSLNDSGEIMIDASTFLPLKDNIIYYVQDKNLYRRYLANPTSLPGQTNAATSTCPPGTGGGCREDRLILENVSNFALEHYDAGNNGPSGITADAATSTRAILELNGKHIGGTTTIVYEVLGTQRNTQ